MISESATQALAELIRRGETLATAESLTGGLLGRLLTDVPGASAAYLGGVISYATRLKVTLAGVDADQLAADGPVAGRTAAAMAAGVARRCGADWGLATTGVAGPDSQDDHPVGQVFVAVAGGAGGAGGAGERARVVELALSGGREAIRRQAADAALDLLVAELAVGDDGVQAAVEVKP